jgi:hypothetical protein
MEKRRDDSRGEGRGRERGAALVLALMVALLLLLVGGALITNTMLSATNMIDATPEAQAYYGAEAGLQGALLALRGNASPTPLFVANPAGGVADGNKLDFRGAITNSVSNLAGDPTTTGFPARLSRWLQYNYTPAGGSYADRVVVSPGTYSPMTGVAYALRLSDLDNSTVVTYSTTGMFASGNNYVDLTNGVNTVRVQYNAQTATTVTAASPVSGQGFGSFTVTKTAGTGAATVPAGTTFNLKINLTAPYQGYIFMTGTLSGSVTPASSSLKLIFSNVSARVRGTLFAMSPLTGTTFAMSGSFGASSSLSFPLSVTVTAPEPERIQVASMGYGPRGARKVLAMEVDRFFWDIRPPAPVVIRGSDTAGDVATFELGNSNAKFYTGKDNSNIQAQLPTLAVSLKDWTVINNGLGKGSTVVDPKISVLDLDPVPTPWPATLTPVPTNGPSANSVKTPPSAQTPDFLQTADAARSFLNDLQSLAQGMSRYYVGPYTGYADSGNDAANVNNPAFTFIDGDCNLDGGSGLLVVTGTLTLKGADDFHGLILVLGGGTVYRSGTGNGNVLGSWLIAKFPRTGTGGFTAPTYDVSGGGNGSFQFDTKAVDDALRTLGMRVVGIAET